MTNQNCLLPLVLSLTPARSRTKHVFFFYKRTVLTVINALAFSKLFLYWCSNTLANTPKLTKLQSIQNIKFAARILTRKCKYGHITPVLKELKWLPVATQLYTLGTLPWPLRASDRKYGESADKCKIYDLFYLT